MDSKEKIQKIKEVLEENLGLIWTDRLVFNHHTKCYRSADMFDFRSGRSTYVYLRDKKNKSYLARVVLTDESFIINLNGIKVDASEHWKELLSQELVASSTK